MRKMMFYFKPFLNQWIAVVILVFIQAISDLYLPTLMSNIVNIGIVHGDINYILRTGGFMIGAALLSIVCVVAAGYMMARISSGFGTILRKKVFDKVTNYSLREFDGIGTASLITRTTNDITQLQQMVLMLRMVIGAPLWMVGGVIMAMRKNPSLSSVIAIATPLLVFVVLVISRKAIPFFQAVQTKLDKLNLVLRERLTGVRVIRAFNREDSERGRFRNANRDLADTSILVNRIMAFVMPMMMLLMNFTTVAILWFGGVKVEQGTMQIGDLMAFIEYVMAIMHSLMMLSMLFVMIPRAQVSADRINEILDTRATVLDENPVKTTEALKGHLIFKDVTFSYPGAQRPALKHITFSANPGEVTAIIGGTGSGKSTLINLIPRFYDTDTGSISIDDVDIREMSQKDLRSKIGFVPQKAVLFSGTVSENIRYGKEDATDEEVEHAANIAQATDFIEGMSEGFNAVIAQGGTNVSGGQKQRLSIARALVRKPQIYIFDDSFSALDFKTDARLRTALKKETRDSTVIIVTQRVSTVLDADKIIVLENGKIAGFGKHKELMTACKVYREIVASQLSEEEIA